MEMGLVPKSSYMVLKAAIFASTFPQKISLSALPPIVSMMLSFPIKNHFSIVNVLMSFTYLPVVSASCNMLVRLHKCLGNALANMLVLLNIQKMRTHVEFKLNILVNASVEVPPFRLLLSKNSLVLAEILTIIWILLLLI
mgnify:CR=1 FL=1